MFFLCLFFWGGGEAGGLPDEKSHGLQVGMRCDLENCIKKMEKKMDDSGSRNPVIQENDPAKQPNKYYPYYLPKKLNSGGGYSICAWPLSYDHRPSHLYHAGTGPVGFSPTRQALLCTLHQARSAVRSSASRMKDELHPSKNRS